MVNPSPDEHTLEQLTLSLTREHLQALMHGPVPPALEREHFGPHAWIIEKAWDAFADGGHGEVRRVLRALVPVLREKHLALLATVYGWLLHATDMG